MRHGAAVACIALGLSVGGLFGCEGPRTEIELFVESRIPEVDTIVVDVTHPDGDTSASTADLRVTAGPRRLRLVHEEGELGPVRLVVRGLDGDTEVVATERVLSFQSERTVRLDVVLAARCAGLDCGDESCGNDGRCRPSEVAACELAVGGCAASDAGTDAEADSGPVDAGPDAGPPDAGLDGGPDAGPDAGPCADFALCGVSDVHLPGDALRPRPCVPSAGGITVSVEEGGLPLPVFGGVVHVVRPGSHVARVSTPSCSAEASFVVQGPTAYDFFGEGGELRDVAGRVDSAVLATSDGAFAIDAMGSVLIVGGGVTEVHRNFNRAELTSSGAWLGASGGHDAYVFVPSPLRSSAAREQALADPVRGATGMALPFRRETPLLYASAEGPVLLGSSTDMGSRLDMSGVTWMVMGMLSEPGRGAIWTGNGAVLRNFSTTGGTTAFGGAWINFDGDIRTVQTVVLDESDGITSLWVCGGEVRRYDVVGDLSASTELPTPSALIEEDCVDMALGDNGEVWVAARFGGVLRYDRNGIEMMRYGAAQGLPGSNVIARLDFASDASGRSLWLLNRNLRAVIRFSADTFAP